VEFAHYQGHLGWVVQRIMDRDPAAIRPTWNGAHHQRLTHKFFHVLGVRTF
jgi:hypothetical protein